MIRAAHALLDAVLLTCALACVGCNAYPDGTTAQAVDDPHVFDRGEPSERADGSCGTVDGACADTSCCPLLLCVPSGDGPSGMTCRAPNSAPSLRAGLYPRASDALRLAGLSAARIIQTIGNAPESGGTHQVDGEWNGVPYTAATDLDIDGLSDDEIAVLLERLARLGFAAWYRAPGRDGWPANDAAHVHAVYADCAMKPILQAQIMAFEAGRNGLLDNAQYRFYTFSATAREAVTLAFATSEHGTRNE